MSEIIPKFHGHVLKYTGDGLIGYFPEPSFITKMNQHHITADKRKNKDLPKLPSTTSLIRNMLYAMGFETYEKWR